MNISIIGTGYVGLVTGACFADSGNNVVCLDLDAAKITGLNSGVIPIHEPTLDILIDRCIKRNTIKFTSDSEYTINHGEIIIIAVGTPSNEDGSADLSYVLNAAEMIGRLINKKSIVITKSTVPVGTGDKIKAAINSQLLKREMNIDVSVVSNPEFLREGDAVRDFKNPDRVVIGTNEKWSLPSLRKLYSPFVANDRPMLEMDLRSAELAKYAANAMLATRISFMNELSNLSEKVGANIEYVRIAMGMDARIGGQFLKPGCGYGGSCFPKDVKALINTGNVDANLTLGILRSVDTANDNQKRIIPEKILNYFNGDIKGKKISIWGLSFKPDTDDIREAPSLTMIKILNALGADITAYDPIAMSEAKKYLDKISIGIKYANTALEAIANTDALILATEWSEFKLTSIEELTEHLIGKVIFDGRNIWNPEDMYDAGINYFSIGRPMVTANGIF